jgi:hypothetical protein
MPDSSDVTGAAVQVRLEGPLFAELENWRRTQPPRLFLARGRSGSCSSARSPAIGLSHDWPAYNDQRRWLTRLTVH